MFTEYFVQKANFLQTSFKDAKEERGGAAVLSKREKDVRIYKEFFDFLREHLPHHFSLATGKVRSLKHLLNRNCDVLIYNKWCPKVLEMTGGYVLSDFLYAFMTIENDLNTQAIVTHSALTRAVKSLYATSKETKPNEIIPLFSILFAYNSSIPLLSHKVAMKDAAKEKEIELNHEIDMVCVLDQGIIVKDWEQMGDYNVIETGADTLMWFFVLLMEYLDRDGKVGFDLRSLIKNPKEYKEY